MDSATEQQEFVRSSMGLKWIPSYEEQRWEKDGPSSCKSRQAKFKSTTLPQYSVLQVRIPTINLKMGQRNTKQEREEYVKLKYKLHVVTDF